MVQLQLLNYLLQTGDGSLLKVNNVDDTFFSDYVSEYTFIRDHMSQYGQVPDKLTFASKFADFDWIEVRENPNYLIDELYRDRNKRTLARVFNGVRDRINAGDIEGAMALFTTSSQDVLSSTHIDSIDIIRDTSRYEAYLERTQDFSKYYVKTGFPELDELVGGWDRLEEYATIVARPGVGKSWVLLRCAMAAAEQGLRCGLYSGEMSEIKVGYRFDTLAGHISNSGIIHGNAELMNTYKAFLDSMEGRFSGCIKVITPKMIKHSATVMDLEAFIEKENLDILFIDQHSLMEDQRRAKDPVTRAANISKDLKNLQVLKRIPIITVSQQNRNMVDENSVIDVSHIAQADRIGQDSTIVIFLEQKNHVLTMHLAKSRDNGAGFKLKYAIDLDRGVFQFVPNEDDALEGSDCEELRQEFEPTYDGGNPF